MQIGFYHIDAFTDHVFGGNPAAVCVLSTWLPDADLHVIARENYLPVTAFLVKGENTFHVRWITPEYELDLCGHGTLAAAYVIFHFLEPNIEKVVLCSRIESLTVSRQKNLITLDFPAKEPEIFSSSILERGLKAKPKEIFHYQNERCMAVFDNEEEITAINPDMEALKQLTQRGIVVTAPGKNCDFVSRTFYPHKSISEDAVTGASHCMLVPYWAKKLNKTDLHAKQLSSRGGELFCRYEGDRVLISGKAVIYVQGHLFV